MADINAVDAKSVSALVFSLDAMGMDECMYALKDDNAMGSN